MIFHYIVTVCLLIGLSSARRSSPFKDKILQPVAADFFLPNNLTVELYELELEPEFVTDTFNGSVRIRFTTHITTNNITLHVNQLNIDLNSINLLSANGTPTNSIVSTSSSNDSRHFFTVNFANPLIEHTTYWIAFGSFGGVLNTENFGFYLGRYTDENGNLVKFATTLFEEIGARQAFPCFDEPALRAEFDIAIIRPVDRQTVSNMPLLNSSIITPNRIRDVFQRTLPMPTYLVAFVVSDFVYVGQGIHRVFGRPQQIADGRGNFALSVSVTVLDAIAEFLGVPYLLPKIDQFALPNDYFDGHGAENWGLVIYSESYLTYISNVSTSSTWETTTTTISHEYTHQCFGNLVSPTWWTYAWINEGLATYMEFYGAAIFAQDEGLVDQTVIRSVHEALDTDNTFDAPPLNQELAPPEDVSIDYYKSAAIMRMVEGFLTTSIFRRGLNIYLNRMQFQAAQPTDLYSSWQEAVEEVAFPFLPPNQTVASVMSTWDSNSGYPLLTVTRNYVEGTTIFSQQRFISTDPNNDSDELYFIPLSFATPNFNSDFGITFPLVWLTIRSGFTTLPGLGPNDWLIMNIDQRGYYRVNYDLTNWYLIINFLISGDFSNVPRTTRANLVHDAFHFGQYGYVDYQVALDLSIYLTRETDYIALYPFFNAISFLNTFLANTAAYNNFRAYTLQVLNASLSNVGLQENAWDNHLTKLNRINVLTWVCRFDGGNCRNTALQQLRAWQNNSAVSIPPNLQTVISCAALSIGDQHDWNFVYQQYLNASETVIGTRFLDALGCSENELILANFLNLIVDVNSGFPYDDRIAGWSSVYNSGNFGRNFAFNYLRLFYGTVVNAFTPGQVNSILTGIASRFSNEAQLAELQSFANSVGGGTAFTNAINTVQGNLNWANTNLGSVLNWLGTSLSWNIASTVSNIKNIQH